MTRSTRLFEILQLLRQADAPLRASDLAEMLEVTPRTIYRDMAVLQARHVPIAGEAGIGYVLRQGFDLPPLMFSAEEMEAILIGLALLGRINDPGLERAASAVTGKIAEVLPESVTTAPFEVSTYNEIPKAGQSAAFWRGAARGAVEVSILYRDAAGSEARRTVKPLSVIYYIDVVVVAAWCTLRSDFRHFRLDRILDAAPTGQTFDADQARLLADWEQSRET